MGKSLHVILPSLQEQVKRYLSAKNNGNPEAADLFIKETLLSRENRGSFKYRLLESFGNYGLQHRWMYDDSSMILRLESAGFHITENYDVPSKNFRLDDGSLHIIVVKG